MESEVTMPITLLLAATLGISTHMTKPTPAVAPFSLSDVKITGGPFATAGKAAAEYLLKVDSDRLLHSFRIHSGLKAKGKIYGGWEDSGLAGHSLGHYLSACAQEYATSGDARFKQRVDYIVAELVACQRSRPDGYIAAMPDGDRMWAEVKKGEIRSRGFDLNGLWSPWYTHHKVFAGLIDAYLIAKNKDALGVAEKFGDWAIEETKALTPDQWQQMLGTEYGGMNDSLAELYALTGKEKFLDLARKFYDKRVLDPLAAGKDELAGKHSNTQIPKIIGLARLYELTGDEKDKKTSEYFWERVVNHHTYAIGGNSDHEYLGVPDKLSDRLSTNTCESCNTYNMLKLTRHLFEWAPNVAYSDYYERAHLNHMLASQNPKDGMMTYFMPLMSGGHRDYSDEYNNWTCCHGSGMETHTKHADSVYFHAGKEKLYVTQFIPTELNWKQAGVTLRQDTDFPNSGKVKLTLGGKSAKFQLILRHPSWAGAFDINVNGTKTVTSKEPGFVTLERTWKKGDTVEFELPMKLRTEAMPDNAKRVALLYGPVVLAADLGPAKGEMPRTPVLVTGDRPVSEWLEPVPGAPLQFRTKGTGRPTELTFKPFYSLHEGRYATYFDEFTDAEWKAEEAAYRAEEERLRDLDARTLDIMRIGEMQPERDHNLKAEKTDVRDANGRGFRTPMTGGWVEFDMKVDPEKATELVMTYWGNERLNPEFEILIDGQKLATETLSKHPINKFFDLTYAVPSEMTKGKSKVVVKVQAVGNKWAGSLAGARTVKAKS